MNRFEKAREALEDFDDFARMAGIEAIGAYDVLSEFIDAAEQDYEFIQDVFECHPNLDLDVKFIRNRDNG